MALTEGDSLPQFDLPTDGGGSISSADLAGKAAVIYFYPKDDTPGCTTEAQGFRDSLEAFQAAGVHIIGISKDSVKRHDNFKAKYDLNFTRASDEDGIACNAFGVWVEKKNYGRTYMGIERSTFLINSAGVVAKAWTKVRVKGHVDAVLEAAEGL
jgi:peroxiredoxin